MRRAGEGQINESGVPDLVQDADTPINQSNVQDADTPVNPKSGNFPRASSASGISGMTLLDEPKEVSGIHRVELTEQDVQNALLLRHPWVLAVLSWFKRWFTRAVVPTCVVAAVGAGGWYAENLRHSNDSIEDGVSEVAALVDSRVGAVLAKMSAIEAAVQLLDKRSDRQDTRLDALDSELRGLKAEVDLLRRLPYYDVMKDYHVQKTTD